MKRIQEYIKRIEKEVSETKIILRYGLVSVSLFDLEQYNELIVKINKK